MLSRSVVIFASLSKWWQNIAILIQIGNGVEFWPLIPTVSLINMHLQLPERLGERNPFIFRECLFTEDKHLVGVKSGKNIGTECNIWWSAAIDAGDFDTQEL